MSRNLGVQPGCSDFGVTAEGERAVEIVLVGDSGATISIVSYGARIRSLKVPDERDGRGSYEAVLGYSDLASYLRDPLYAGAVVGRVAGRIVGGEFLLDNRLVSLHVNNSGNCLHGGGYFDRAVWEVEGYSREAARLSYVSPDGEGGFPGEVTVQVTYYVTPDDTVRIEYDAVTTRPTPLSLTQHTYFNLSGNLEHRVLDHQVWVDSKRFVPVDLNLTPLDRVESVTGGLDLQTPRSVATVAKASTLGHGELYQIAGEPGTLRRVAGVRCPSKARSLEVWSTQPYLQLFTGSMIPRVSEEVLGRAVKPFVGLSLECQGYPNGINAPRLGDITLCPGDRYREITEWRFS